MSTHSDAFTAAEFVLAKVNVSAVTDILTGGWHRSGEVPPADSCPYGTIHLVPIGDLQIVNGIRVWAAFDVDVVAVGNDYLQMDAIDRAAGIFDPLLQAKSGSTTSGRAFSCARIRPIFFEETDEGITFVYSGGSYRITARANPT